MNYISDPETRSGTICGTLLVLLYSVDPTQLLSSVILAATGAFVSFVVSLGCKYLWRRINRK